MRGISPTQAPVIAVAGARALGAALLLASLAGCGLPGAARPKPVVWHDLAYTTPATMAGYSVAEEAKAARGLRDGGAESLLDAGRLYSFRTGTRLFATLEVGELKPTAAAADPAFQQSVVAQIGTTVMRATQVDGQTVYVGNGNRQLIYVWFKARLMHVLLTHDIKDPTPLLHEALNLA